MKLQSREVIIGSGTYKWLFDEDIYNMVRPGYRAKIETIGKRPKMWLYMTYVSFPGLSSCENIGTVMNICAYESMYRVDCHNIPEFWMEISDTFDKVKGRFPGPRKHDFVIDRRSDLIQVHAQDILSGIVDKSFTINFMLRNKIGRLG